MARIFAGIIAALVAVIALLTWQYRAVTAQKAQLAAENSALATRVRQIDRAARSADRAVLAARQQAASAAAAAEVKDQAVERALADEATWASTPIPKAILEALDASDSPSATGDSGSVRE